MQAVLADAGYICDVAERACERRTLKSGASLLFGVPPRWLVFEVERIWDGRDELPETGGVGECLLSPSRNCFDVFFTGVKTSRIVPLRVESSRMRRPSFDI